MGTYSEISRRQDNIVHTLVEFDFDGIIVECDITHFCPQSEEEIQIGIQNRMISEERNLNI